MNVRSSEKAAMQLVHEFHRHAVNKLPTHPLFVAPIGWAVDPVGFATVWPFVNGVPVGRVCPTAASSILRLWRISAIKALSHAILNEFASSL